MATRPIFISTPFDKYFIKEVNVDFKWVPGMAKTQKQKSIDALHIAAEEMGYGPILEISSKSKNLLGVKLSAFNLKLKIVEDTVTTVETAYQGSKVFEKGGPFIDLYEVNSIEAKRDYRLSNSGELIGFELNGVRWELRPETAFYDWLYISALIQNQELASEILKFKVFTDIEFNPEKQYSCQARSAAYYVSLNYSKMLQDFMTDKNDFLELYKNRPNADRQYDLLF